MGGGVFSKHLPVGALAVLVAERLIHAHGLDDRPALVAGPPAVALAARRHGRADVGRILRRRPALMLHVAQLDIIVHAPGDPDAAVGVGAGGVDEARAGAGVGDALLALAADVAVLVEGPAAAAGRGGGLGRAEDVAAASGVVARVGAVAAAGLEAAEAEDAADNGPAVRDVGHHHGSRPFSRVPIQVDERPVGRGEVVVAVQDGRQNAEDAEGEDGAEDGLAAAGEAGFDEEGNWDQEHEDVGGDVEGGGLDSVESQYHFMRCRKPEAWTGTGAGPHTAIM